MAQTCMTPDALNASFKVFWSDNCAGKENDKEAHDIAWKAFLAGANTEASIHDLAKAQHIVY